MFIIIIVVSVWELPREQNITSVLNNNINNYNNKTCSPVLKCSINLSGTDSNNNINNNINSNNNNNNNTEVINKLQIIMHGLFLLVSTNKRLLLFYFDSSMPLPSLSKVNSFDDDDDDNNNTNNNNNNNNNSNDDSLTTTTTTTTMPFLSGWVELDRVLPGIVVIIIIIIIIVVVVIQKVVREYLQCSLLTTKNNNNNKRFGDSFNGK